MRFKLILTGLTLIVGQAEAGCLAENAVYRNLEDEQFSISFSEQKNPKAWSNILATLKTPHRNFDFEFTSSNGYAMQYMVLLSKNVKQDKDIEVDFLDKDLKDILLPQVGDAAPELIFAPQLGLWMWYANLKEQEFIPRGLWKLSDCQG
jgi:hypothetical protein